MILRTSAKSRLIEPGDGDQVGDALHALTKNVVRHSEGLDDRRLTLDDRQQPVVRDHDDRVDLVAQRPDPVLRLIAALLTLERERPRDDTDRERPELTRDLGHHRSAARAGAPALAGGDEHHVGALESFLQLVAALHRSLVPNLRVGAGAQAPGPLRADVQLHVGVAHEQGLRVRVHGDELDALEARVDHAADGVAAAPAYTQHLDDCQIAPRLISHSQVTSSLRLNYNVASGYAPVHQSVNSQFAGKMWKKSQAQAST